MADRRFGRSALATVLVVAAVLAACDRRPPEARLERPTADQLAATPNAVGVTYGRHVVIRHGDRLIALVIVARSPLGDRVSYEWHATGDERDFRRPDAVERGSGEAVEKPYTGRIALPDRLVLEWSRGSDEFGWLYWPDPRVDYAVYSRPFADLDELAGGLRGGRWLTREMFQR